MLGALILSLAIAGVDQPAKAVTLPDTPQGKHIAAYQACPRRIAKTLGDYAGVIRLWGAHRPRRRFDSSAAHHLTVQRHEQLAIGDHGDRTEESNRRHRGV